MLTYKDLVDLSVSLSQVLPPDVKGVLGISRKGMVVASILATKLFLKLGEVYSFPTNGYFTSNSDLHQKPTCESGPILVVDDGVGSGKTISDAMKFLCEKLPNERFISVAAVAIEGNVNYVDYLGTKINPLMLQEAEFPNVSAASSWMMDMDGVVCEDPTEFENDDEKKWSEHFASVKPLYLPRRTPTTIVTARLEKYRDVTCAWLNTWDCKYKKIHFSPASSLQERGNYVKIGEWKAEVYKNSDSTLFIESCPLQSEIIVTNSGKPVYCVTSKSMLLPSVRPFNKEIKTWDDIEGWFDECGPYYGCSLYREAVENLPDNAKIVEVGVWKGRSTSFLDGLIKKSGKKVEHHVVDNFVGSASDRSMLMLASSGETLKDVFTDNIKKCGVDNVIVHVGDSVKCAEDFENESLDFVYLDADHSYEAVYRDLEAWFPKVKVGGIIAGHDYDKSTDPGVPLAVKGFFSNKGFLVDNRDTRNFWVKNTKIATFKKTPKIVLSMPYSGPVDMRVSKAFWTTTCKYAVVEAVANSCTLLARNFNILYASALSMYDAGVITHMAMLHDDILPCEGWLDILWEEMYNTGATMISSVVAIKDDRGLTSTAIDDPVYTWEAGERLTSSKIMKLPETFVAKDTEFPDRALLVNSGCWLLDLSDNRLRTLDDKNELVAFFTVNDRIVKRGGLWASDCESEDWFFSKRLFDLGIKVAATRKVKTVHLGDVGWTNDIKWGTLSEDDRGGIAKLRQLAAAYNVQENPNV